MPERKRHPIRVVARRTGLSPEVIRVWEKRYGAVEPGRTDTGRRLYSDKDIERLRLIRNVTLSGHRVGEVSALPIRTLEALAQEDGDSAAAALPGTSPGRTPSARASSGNSGTGATLPESRGSLGPWADRILEECLDAMRDLDGPRLETILTRSLLASGSTAIIDDLVGPLLRKIGDLWEGGRIDPYHEHLVTGVIHQTIARHFVWQSVDASAPKAVVCTPAGQHHEIGAILVSCALSAAGWRVVHLGANLPARDIAMAAEQTQADLVALSIIHPSGDPELITELTTLRDRLPDGVKIVVGGDAAGSYAKTLRKIGAEVAHDIRSLSGIRIATPENAPARSPQGDGHRSDRPDARP